MSYTVGMPERASGVHVSTTRRVYKGREYRSHLLRRSFREEGKVKKETVANITSLGDEIVELVRACLQGKQVRVVEDAFRTLESKPHGHALAVLTAIKRLEFERLLASRPSRERSLVVGMVAQQVLRPGSKLSMVRSWGNSSLAGELGIVGAGEDELYAAMDWLIGRKDAVEGRLAERHLADGERVLFDLTCTSVEGEKCELAEFGYPRGGKRGKKQINWGVLANGEGVPVGLHVFPGNTGDPDTFMPQVERLRERYGLESFTIVGDRGMISGKHIETLAAIPGVQWITALKSTSIRPLIAEGAIQPSLFEESNLFELSHADYPGERLIACRNPMLELERRHKRQELLDATTMDLERIKRRVDTRRLKGKDKIGLAVGKIIGKHKVGKHIDLEIDESSFDYQVNHQKVDQEALLDGIYVIRTSVPAEELSAGEAVRAYKDLSRLEDSFKVHKSELQVGPIRHWIPDRVKAHFFICTLAYYLRMHMQKAWASLTFKDEHPDTDRDPVAPAERSESATAKAQTGRLPDGEKTQSFKDLLDSLQTIVKNTNYFPQAKEATFTTITEPTPQQQQALDLLQTISL
jgi:hypothetical protein